MHTPRHRRGLWFALLAAALNALSPLAAYARSHVLALPMELCSTMAPEGADGLATVPIPGAPGEHATHLPHCTFCPASGLSLPGLPAGHGLLVAGPGVRCPALIARDLPRSASSGYLPSRPRGPPAALLS